MLETFHSLISTAWKDGRYVYCCLARRSCSLWGIGFKDNHRLGSGSKTTKAYAREYSHCIYSNKSLGVYFIFPFSGGIF